MAEKVPIFQVVEHDLEIVGELIIWQDGEQCFSERTPLEVVKQFTNRGLPLPKYTTVEGFWAKIRSIIKDETIRVYPDDPRFPAALEYHNEIVSNGCDLSGAAFHPDSKLGS